jgi:hypothetical protein
MTTQGPSCRVELVDPFGDSALMFDAGPAGGSVPLWVAAGQVAKRCIGSTIQVTS